MHWFPGAREWKAEMGMLCKTACTSEAGCRMTVVQAYIFFSGSQI